MLRFRTLAKKVKPIESSRALRIHLLDEFWSGADIATKFLALGAKDLESKPMVATAKR